MINLQDESETEDHRLTEDEILISISPFDQLDVITGQDMISLELLKYFRELELFERVATVGKETILAKNFKSLDKKLP